MDATDDEDPWPAARDVHDLDRPAVVRAPELLRWRRQHERCDHGELARPLGAAEDAPTAEEEAAETKSEAAAADEEAAETKDEAAGAADEAAAAGEDLCCKQGDETPPLELVQQVPPGGLHNPYDWKKLVAESPEVGVAAQKLPKPWVG